MNRLQKRVLGLVLLGASVSSLLGCELIVQLDDALVDSGADTGATLFNCSICDPDASADADAEPDSDQIPDAPKDAVSEKPVEDTGASDAKTADAKTDANPADAKAADAKATD